MTMIVIGISCAKKFSGSDGLPYIYSPNSMDYAAEIADCTNRDMASRIKQIMIQSFKRNMDKIKAHIRRVFSDQ